MQSRRCAARAVRWARGDDGCARGPRSLRGHQRPRGRSQGVTGSGDAAAAKVRCQEDAPTAPRPPPRRSPAQLIRRGQVTARAVHVRHLSLVDFRSMPSRSCRSTRASPRSMGLNGQGKTNLVEAIGYVATLAVTGWPPTRHWCGSGRARRSSAPRSCATVARPLVELEMTRAGPTGRGSTGPPHADPRRPRHPADGALRARGPRAWSRATRRSAGVPRRPARGAAAPLGRGSGRLRQDPQAAQRPAEVGGARAAQGPSRRRSAAARLARPCTATGSALHTLDIWNTQLAEVGAQLLYARLRLLRDLGPFLAAAYDGERGSQPGSASTARVG
jgi:DNA replication and repair protein RecF